MKVQKSLLRGKCTANFCCWAGDKECEQALWAAIQRLTLEQLGQAILEILSKSISQVCHLSSVLVNPIKMPIIHTALLSSLIMSKYVNHLLLLLVLLLLLFHDECCCYCDCFCHGCCYRHRYRKHWSLLLFAAPCPDLVGVAFAYATATHMTTTSGAAAANASAIAIAIVAAIVVAVATVATAAAIVIFLAVAPPIAIATARLFLQHVLVLLLLLQFLWHVMICLGCRQTSEAQGSDG